MKEKTIRVLMDKRNNRFAIHDVVTGDLLHIFYPNKEIESMTPQQITESENEAIRDFMVNGIHDEQGEDEAGW